ncbi:peptidyl-prolyl cis-trans isomerase CYP37, chloroplastic isoform X2 [Arachis ipaensis]|uniref:peptidyl-prolyl cis-trans isomerase CYP37, chloroplastic isoform X2 n=1 Tax=Arachis ipaensis TaxID=130454 RepID=UPI000A2B6487|nr:peptidyl-prolyl cis-trans isomerase CYP37, chloroplastic isoform X2 [Arachis ipaensis]XP_025643825.1 peptidyl-prolyl cis-trans isomerase CYP37, chloroplastic isoform X2 [Arachis hypogaea]
MSLSFSSSSLTVSLTRELSSSSFSPATTTRSFFYRTRPACSPSSTITCFSNSKNHLARAIELAKELVAGQRDTSASVAAEASFVKQLKLKNLVPAIIVSVQITLLLPLVGPWDYSGSYLSPSAMAILYSPDTKVPRTGEVALRRAIPANANMKSIQDSLEDISYLLRIPQRKPYGTMEGNVKKALKIAVDQKESILASIPAELKEKGSLVHASLIDGKAPGISFLLPEQYVQYPRLSGRGTVEFTIEKGDGSTFSPVGGESKKTATIQVVIDGYSAPLTAGNFAKLVMDGAYDGAKLSTSNQAILSDNGADKNSGFSVPLEIMPSGQFEPLYKTTLSVQDGELPVLPLSVYGAVAMAHNEVSDEYSSPYQFFFYLYDKRSAGLGGISFDEGQFSVFGYTTNGRDILPQIKTGDIIRSAKLVEGQDRLVLSKDS